MRIGIIGHTGRGNYGHGLDVCWREIPEAEIVAVSDPDAEGRARAQQKMKAPKAFQDYERMMDMVKPDIVSICPRHVDQHRDMFLAAAERGISAYMEKPAGRSPAEVDEMIAACETYGVKLAIAHLTRYAPAMDVIRDLIMDDGIGEVLEVRLRGKEDRRGGGEDLWVLGSHLLNTTVQLFGEPQWCFGTLEQDGRAVTAQDVVEGPEGLGPLAGNQAHAIYGFNRGLKVHFDSVQNRGTGKSFGLRIYGTKGQIHLTEGYVPRVMVSDTPWQMPAKAVNWTPLSSEGLGKPETMDSNWRLHGNIAAARDLMAAVKEDRLPECNIQEVRWTIEMICAVFASHVAAKPVEFPLQQRENALSGWTPTAPGSTDDSA